MKRSDMSSSSDASAPEPKKRKVTYSTYQKWKAELDHDCQTVTWLECDTEVSGKKKIVTKLRCGVCAQFKERIATRRNFSEKCLLGAESVRTSNIRDHAKADQHTHAMILLRREQARRSGSGPASYAPTARALSRMSDTEKDQLRHKFDIAYLKRFHFESIPGSASWKHAIKLPSEAHTQTRSPARTSLIS